MTETKENVEKHLSSLILFCHQYIFCQSPIPASPPRTPIVLSRDIVTATPASDSDKEDICSDHPASLNVGGRGEK